MVAAEAYENLLYLDSAIAELSKAIKCKKYAKDEHDISLFHFRDRAELYVRQGALELAEADLDEIVKRSQNSIRSRNERAVFYIEVSHDYESAIFDLNQIILGIPDESLAGCNVSWRQYAETYFNLGRAEYMCGLKDEAFHHWVKASECRFSMGLRNAVIEHLDSIILKHSNSANLYLARALSQQNRAVYQGGGESSRACHRYAIADIARAQELGIDDFRVDYLTAISLHSLKQISKAISALDRAIVKAPDNAKLYLLRYDYREDIGLAKYGDENDSDILKWKELCPRWRFSKY